MNSFYAHEELIQLGLKHLGDNVLISRKASLYGLEGISFGNNVRVDDFCILSGKIKIEDYVHIAAGCYAFAGDAGISFGEFSTISSRCAVYAISDDYSGQFLTNPTVPMEYRRVVCSPVRIGRHCIVGTGSTILPGVILADGCSFGAMSLISKSTEPWGIYVGIPCKRVKERSRELEKFAEHLE